MKESIFMKSTSPILSDISSCLTLASFFEREFCIDWIIEISGHKPSHVFVLFEAAVQQGWLLKKPDGFFAFQDSKIQKQLKEAINLKEQQFMHRQIVEFLLKESHEDKSNQESIAHHLLFIHNDLEHCHYLLNSADHARRMCSYKVASSYYIKIMNDLRGRTETEAVSLSIEAAIRYARISLARENTQRVSSILQEAILIAKKYNMVEESSLLLMHMAKNDFLSGRYRLAMQHVKEGWAALEGRASDKFLSSAIAFQFYAEFWQGHLRIVIEDYEQHVASIENFPSERHRILSTGMVGFCYTQTGQFSQGLGMLNALRKQRLENNDQFLAEDIAITIAGAMIELRRTDEALPYLRSYIKNDNQDSDWNVIRAKLALAAVYFFQGKQKEAVYYFNQWLNLRISTNVHIMLIPFAWFEICKAMEVGTFPCLGNIHLEEEVLKFIEDENVLLKGVAYRYKAFLQEQKREPSEKIIESLNLSVQYLEESGHILELCRTYIELMQQYILISSNNDVKEIKSKISTLLMDCSCDFIPDEFNSFIRKIGQDWHAICDEILKLSQDMSSIRDQKQLLQTIISTANRISGAERGAIFGVETVKDKNTNKNLLRIQLKASKNITSVQVSSKAFESANKMIEEVAQAGKSKILKNVKVGTSPPEGFENILSQICVPMIIRNKVVGVLYLENNLFINSFEDNDLQLLNYFATQAAIALDHAEAYEEIQLLNNKLNEEKQYYKEQSLPNIHFDSFIGKSPRILEVLNKINQVAGTEANILILGETGTGKGLVAQAIHRHSKRNDRPFVKVLCNALSESLISSELFGHEKGAFTGSVQRQIGRFELADGGTIFLDEIGDLKEDIQTRLLQVIQSKEFERVGSSKTIRSDFRLITATNRDLAEAVKNKKFRADLYYRLNVFPIIVPPLRERKEDIPLLANHFLNMLSKKTGKSFIGIPKSEMDKLLQYEWPGNIRELEGIIERGGILSNNGYFRVPELGMEQHVLTDLTSVSTLEDYERSCILQALKKTNWKVRGEGGAAALLNLNYSTLFFRMKKLGIRRPSDMPKGRKKMSLAQPERTE